MLVCTVGLVGMASLLAVTLRMQQLGRNSTSAVRLAQDKVDELSTISFGTAGTSVCNGGSLTANVANYNDTTEPEWTIRWLVQPGPDGDVNLKQVTVRVIPSSTDRRVTTPYQLVAVIRGGVAAVC